VEIGGGSDFVDYQLGDKNQHILIYDEAEWIHGTTDDSGMLNEIKSGKGAKSLQRYLHRTFAMRKQEQEAA
jgi:hypothetical protein